MNKKLLKAIARVDSTVTEIKKFNPFHSFISCDILLQCICRYNKNISPDDVGMWEVS